MITCNNITVVGCDVGILTCDQTNLIVNKATFEGVGTCYQVANLSKLPSSLNTDKPTQFKNEPTQFKNKPTQFKNKSSNFFLEMKTRQTIQNLFNLEIKSLINNDLIKLKRVRKLKGQIGSINFEKNYSSLAS